MRQRFNNNNQNYNKNDYAKFLNTQIQEKKQRENENKIIEQASDIYMMQMPQSKVQIYSIFDNQDFQKRHRMQQQLLEQDICNYNRMVAEQRKLDKVLQKQQQDVHESNITKSQFPKIRISSVEPSQRNQNNQIQNLSQSYIQQGEKKSNYSRISGTVNQRLQTANSNKFNEFSELKSPIQTELLRWELQQKQEIKQRQEQLNEIRNKMHENYEVTRRQISSLMDFIKYNKQQQQQFETLLNKIKPLGQNEKIPENFPFIKAEYEKRMNQQKYFHYNEFLEQINDELKNSSNYLQIDNNNNNMKINIQEDIEFEL